MQPDYAAQAAGKNAYLNDQYRLGFSWYQRNAGSLAGGATAGLFVASTVLTMGLAEMAAPWFAAAGLATTSEAGVTTLTLGGTVATEAFANGATGTLVSGLISVGNGNSAGQVLKDTASGGLIGGGFGAVFGGVRYAMMGGMYASRGAQVAAAEGRAGAVEAEGFIGPTIGRSGYRTMGEFRDATFTRYQQFYDQADAIVRRQVAAGRIANDPMVIGGRMDQIARARMTRWLNTEGINNTGPAGIIQLNRRLYNATGSSYRVPDVRIRGANIIFDGTIANSPMKSGLTPQIIDFQAFSGGNNVVIVRPTRLGGSYGIFP